MTRKHLLLVQSFVLFISSLCANTASTTEQMFNDFIALSTNVSSSIENKQLRSIAKTVTDFATLDGHYLETYEDTGQIAYKGILEEEYYPLLTNLQKLNQGQITEYAFFEMVLSLFIENQRDSCKQAKAAHEEDKKFQAAKGTFGLYKTGVSLNFFRNPRITPSCEDFLNTENSKLTKNWNPRDNKIKEWNQLLKLRGLLSSELVKEKEKMQELKDRILPYRDMIEKFYNCLLWQSWSLLTDPNRLSKKTKKIINSFEYIWGVLKTGKNETSNLDTLIWECSLCNAGQLMKVFELSDSTKKVKKVKLRIDLCKVCEPKTLDLPVTSTGTKDESNLETLKQYAVREDECTPPAEIILSFVQGVKDEPSVDRVDQVVEKAYPIGLDEKSRKVQPIKAQPINKLKPAMNNTTPIFSPIEGYFEPIRNTKHIQYKQIAKLLEDLGGLKIRTRGSHETWQLKDYKGDNVMFGFWRLHGKDQYGPWTKKLVLDLQSELMETIQH